MPIDIILCSDKNQYLGMFGTINSIMKNTKNPINIHIHLLVKDGEYDLCNNLVKKHFPNYNIDIKEFNNESHVNFLNNNIKVTHKKASYVNRVSNIMNFARFYIADIYPELKKIIYLDSDMIVQADIHELYNSAKLLKHYFAAVSGDRTGVWHGMVTTSPHLKHFKFHKANMFNAGMFVTDLEKWRSNKIRENIEKWMTLHKNSKDKNGLFTYGTQPVINLAFFNNYDKINPIWNFFTLGHVPNINENIIKRQKILHWAGKMKPWISKGWYKKYWNKYEIKIILE